MNKLLITPSPQRIEEASRAVRRHWGYEERRARRRAADRRQVKLLRAVLPVKTMPATRKTDTLVRRQHAWSVVAGADHDGQLAANVQ